MSATVFPAAMVLAAGKGTRLGELGLTTAKAVTEVDGEPLVRVVLRRLCAAGIQRCVINLHHLGEQVKAIVGDGQQLGIEVAYSHEEQLLDVAGGIAQALPLLGPQPFLLVNVDILTDFDLRRLVQLLPAFDDRLAHLVLGHNQDFRPAGDFALRDGQVQPLAGDTGHTYIGTAAYAPALFADLEPGQPAPMQPLWQAAMAAGRVTGELHGGHWLDVGTPERLRQAQTG